MACCHLLLVRCRHLQRSAKCKYTHYRSTYCLDLRGADVRVWDSDPGSREFGPSRERTGEPLNSRSRILAPNWREITGVDCNRILCPIKLVHYTFVKAIVETLRLEMVKEIFFFFFQIFTFIIYAEANCKFSSLNISCFCELMIMKPLILVLLFQVIFS